MRRGFLTTQSDKTDGKSSEQTSFGRVVKTVVFN